MNKFYILFFLVTLQAFSQEKNTPDFITDSIPSKYLAETRAISISLPDNFSIDEKYPVIYILDGEALFEPMAQQAAQLSAFSVIPHCIVVSIPNTNRQRDLSLNWETGHYTNGSLAFSRFISNELIDYVESKYPVSGFSIIVGHSNGASFIHNFFTSGNIFQGYVALSQSLSGQQEQQFAEALRLPLDNKYYFVASGTRDSDERLESGLAMDSIYKRSLTGLKFSHEVYTANHEGIFIRGLGPGLAFVFSDYYHLNYSDELIDRLLE
ncbi:MAG TPA: alpha/beta hydrolase-fold protein, partial [Flavobacterium sp.]|nr:alpha/beta hydrolase-fold protein [Flavobacterium sp.]